MAKMVIMEMNERQAQTVLNALEEYFRLRMGQANMCGLAEDLAFATYDRSKDTSGKGFDLALQRRDNINHILNAIFRIVWPIGGMPDQTPEHSLIAGDMWSQLRWDLSKKEKYQTRPFQLGPEPLPNIKVLEVTEQEGG